ncbi:aminotransferase class V-fold PLP-dependent enzyme [Microbacterium sp. NPDC089189]|uniref:aminotransferase class V-fold PLP-dependent enzyme n=1 Tax=Microbacterium sp. NPDC089189 TaxID=3154972 RepID=UPI003414165F
MRAAFAGGRGYLAACTGGLPPRAAHEALRRDLERSVTEGPDLGAYSDDVEASRGHIARLLGVSPARIAIGSQTSVQVSLLAASLPIGAEVVCAEADFSSLLLPFAHAGRDLRLRSVPLAELPGAVTAQTALVAFSLVQSATGEVADIAAISAAARAVGALTLCDGTQAVGWMPVDAGLVDAFVVHSYKWLCAPRGVAFLALAPRLAAALRPAQAGWYAGADPWRSCYGSEVELASDARRFDVSPAWQAFVGARPALALFAHADVAAIHAYTTGLAGRFAARIGLPVAARPTAIVTWSDPDGRDLAALRAAGLVVSGRAGRARVAFHVFNDDEDVDTAAASLGR